MEAEAGLNDGLGWIDLGWPEEPLIFIKEGVMINQHNYNEILESKVFPWVNSKYARASCTF